MSKKSDYKLRNMAFLKQVSAEEGIHKVAKGVLYRILQSGDPAGKCPNLRNIVCVHYTGQLINGKVFDDSRTEACPAAFRLYELIEGWQIALTQMRPGDRWQIYIPSELGYGSRSDGDIPGNSTLIFDIELISIG